MGIDVDRLGEWACGSGPGLLESSPHIDVDCEGSPGSPDKTAGEEYREEEHAVVPLGLAAGHVDFVEEPMDIEEGG